MKKLAASNNRSLFMTLVLVCVMTAGSVSAFAQSKSPIVRTIYQGETHTGTCCSLWGDPIRINEPEKIAPIIVTWSTDYRANAPLIVGLKLNGGPCAFYGPAFLPTFQPEDQTYQSKTFQWVIMPGDYKLTSGNNEIKICGGGVYNSTDTVTLGFSTFTAHLQK